MEWLRDTDNLKTLLKIAALFISVTILTFIGYRLAQEDPVTPCSEAGLPRRCYHVTEPVCEAIWKKGLEECNEFVKSFHLPPGRLVGPIIHQCQLSSFDEAFVYSRKSTEECAQLGEELKNWRRKNR